MHRNEYVLRQCPSYSSKAFLPFKCINYNDLPQSMRIEIFNSPRHYDRIIRQFQTFSIQVQIIRIAHQTSVCNVCSIV